MTKRYILYLLRVGNETEGAHRKRRHHLRDNSPSVGCTRDLGYSGIAQ